MDPLNEREQELKNLGALSRDLTKEEREAINNLTPEEWQQVRQLNVLARKLGEPLVGRPPGLMWI